MISRRQFMKISTGTVNAMTAENSLRTKGLLTKGEIG